MASARVRQEEPPDGLAPFAGGRAVRPYDVPERGSRSTADHSPGMLDEHVSLEVEQCALTRKRARRCPP